MRAHRVVHGKVSQVHHDGQGVFEGLPSPVTAMRYHSLVVEPESLPAELVVSAWLEPDPEEGGDSLIMGLRHRHWPVETVQFHPESVATEHGQALGANIVAWLLHDRARDGAIGRRC
jgi:anthranilate synthase component 2